MSVNTAHANNGVLIHAGEAILLFSENVTMDFYGQDGQLFKGTKTGRIYLTTHRMIFNNNKGSDPLQSLSFPFICLTDVELEQPVFGANYIKGKVRAQDNGHFTGEAKFKLIFKNGGAIDFGQSMLRAAHMAKQNAHNQPPPPYTAPTGSWYEAPPPAYTANPVGYYGWMPNTQAFPDNPAPNSVFMTDNPPPYPGIIPSGMPNGYPGGQQPGYPGAQQPGYPGGQQPGYPGGPQPGYTGGQQPSYPGGQPQQPPGYPGYNAGAQPSAPGYPGVAAGGGGGYPGGYAPQPAFNPHNGYGGQPGFPGSSQQGYPAVPPAYQPNNQGAMGFSMPPAQPPPNQKENEAAQSAYYDPNQPQTAYVPPPAYYEPPPSYTSLANKKQE